MLSSHQTMDGRRRLRSVYWVGLEEARPAPRGAAAVPMGAAFPPKFPRTRFPRSPAAPAAASEFGRNGARLGCSKWVEQWRSGPRSAQGKEVSDPRRELGQERLARHAADSIDLTAFGTPVEKEALGLRIIIAKRLQSPEVGGIEVRSVLDLDCKKSVFTVDDQVDLVSAPRAPVRKGSKNRGYSVISRLKMTELP